MHLSSFYTDFIIFNKQAVTKPSAASNEKPTILFVCKNPWKRKKSLECFEVQIRLNEMLI